MDGDSQFRKLLEVWSKKFHLGDADVHIEKTKHRGRMVADSSITIGQCDQIPNDTWANLL